MPDITLYFAPASRSFTPRWLLEEIGVPYSIKTIDLRRNEHKAPDYLRINPMGKVPALTDGAVTVSENPAICIYLADRYSLGTLAPPLDDPGSNLASFKVVQIPR
jgi:glutathione S-transferase